MPLTKRYIDASKYQGVGNARDVRWDDDPKGLGLRIFPSGRKTFVLSYRAASGIKRLATLGDMPLDEARLTAKRMLVGVVDDKLDPIADRRRRRLEAKTGTVAAVVDAYIKARTGDPHRPMKRPESVRWYADKFIVPTFGSRPWREVRRSEVRDWHSGIAKPYNANRALQALRAAFYWRLWQEDDSPGNRRRESDTRNPCAGIDLRPETRRQVRLELAELPKLEKAIDSETDDPYLRAFLRFVLATGCRRSEALTLKWNDVVLPVPATEKAAATPGTATFRNTKARTDHQAALSAYGADQLRGLKQLAGNPYVFVGRVHGSHLQEPSKAWQRIRRTAGLEHLRIHDLRRSFGSWLGDAGFTSKQVGTVLGHNSDITSRVYMALGDSSKRAAVDAVDRLMAGKPAKVETIAGRRKQRA